LILIFNIQNFVLKKTDKNDPNQFCDDK
jgi:hypothetical protein